MALTPRLELRQAQSLVMTPQLRQAIQMLQMSGVELSAFLAAEVERNPLIELADPAAQPIDPAPFDGAGREAQPPPAPPERIAVDAEIRRADLDGADSRVEAAQDNLYESAEPSALRGPSGAKAGSGAGGRDPFDPEGEDAASRLAQGVTLAQHVVAQLGLARLAPQTRLVAEALACELDEAGYLRVDPAEAAARLGAPQGMVEQAMAAIRACEPTGVGARDLAECLALQLAERDRLDPAMAALLARLDELPRTPAPRMAERVGVSLEDLEDMLAEIRRLDPRPGLAFSGGVADPVIPDVLARPDGAGGWVVELNPDAAPRVLVDRSYAARVAPRNGAGCRETRMFLADCAQSASWLTRSLDQRARTILSISAEIVRAQAGFFDHGVGALRPMTLRAVAEAAGVHESTVSRATANKFIATPRGLFELKFFFSAALASSDGGEAHSAQAVRGRIRALIDAEPPGRPLSDDALVAMLRSEGVDVARRTVAKYREGMGIGSSVARRRRAAAAV
ncbi:MAG: RNA polymerase factor sigma-54 [Rubrimonas sp.]|uniref:RNA polymerase factor sigma-54 n=1 Tax=Rubrimonas sp. TaxID=2036015 RepID=UPI002FDD7D01